MDPNAILGRIRELSDDVLDGTADPEDCDELAGHILALDEWIRRGGFLPDDWELN